VAYIADCGLAPLAVFGLLLWLLLPMERCWFIFRAVSRRFRT
jgi:hypothetical protein